MKKIALITLSLVFIAGISSCGKTTKRKLVNDWKVTASSEKMEFSNSSGDHSSSTLTTTENEVTVTDVFEPSTGPSTTNSNTGSVKINEFIIRKDGTWSMEREIFFESGTTSSTEHIAQSGTWSFLKNNKSDDFKKNERVHFNVLKSEKLQTTSLSGSVVTNNSYAYTYLTGEKVLVYTIKESKKDQLEMELETSTSLTQTAGNGYSESLIQKLTLTGK